MGDDPHIPVGLQASHGGSNASGNINYFINSLGKASFTILVVAVGLALGLAIGAVLIVAVGLGNERELARVQISAAEKRAMDRASAAERNAVYVAGLAEREARVAQDQVKDLTIKVESMEKR